MGNIVFVSCGKVCKKCVNVISVYNKESMHRMTSCHFNLGKTCVRNTFIKADVHRGWGIHLKVKRFCHHVQARLTEDIFLHLVFTAPWQMYVHTFFFYVKCMPWVAWDKVAEVSFRSCAGGSGVSSKANCNGPMRYSVIVLYCPV